MRDGLKGALVVMACPLPLYALISLAAGDWTAVLPWLLWYWGAWAVLFAFVFAAYWWEVVGAARLDWWRMRRRWRNKDVTAGPPPPARGARKPGSSS